MERSVCTCRQRVYEASISLKVFKKCSEMKEYAKIFCIVFSRVSVKKNYDIIFFEKAIADASVKNTSFY